MMGFGLETRKRPIDGSSNLPRATIGPLRIYLEKVKKSKSKDSESRTYRPRRRKALRRSCQKMKVINKSTFLTEMLRELKN